jgi:hypothetical protein
MERLPRPMLLVSKDGTSETIYCKIELCNSRSIKYENEVMSHKTYYKTYVVRNRDTYWTIRSVDDFGKLKQELVNNKRVMLAILTPKIFPIEKHKGEDSFDLSENNLHYLTLLMKASGYGKGKRNATLGIYPHIKEKFLYASLASGAISVTDHNWYTLSSTSYNAELQELCDVEQSEKNEQFDFNFKFETVQEHDNMTDFEKYCLERDRAHKQAQENQNK